MKDLQLFSLSGFSCIKILSDQFICCIYSFSMFELPSFNNNVLLIILLLISLGSPTVIIEDKHYGFSGPQSLGGGGRILSSSKGLEDDNQSHLYPVYLRYIEIKRNKYLP